MSSQSNTNVHFNSDEIVGMSVLRLVSSSDREVFALKIGTPHWNNVTLFMDKQQFTDICRDMEVLYMVEILGADEKEVRS